MLLFCGFNNGSIVDLNARLWFSVFSKPTTTPSIIEKWSFLKSFQSLINGILFLMQEYNKIKADTAIMTIQITPIKVPWSSSEFQ